MFIKPSSLKVLRAADMYPELPCQHQLLLVLRSADLGAPQSALKPKRTEASFPVCVAFMTEQNGEDKLERGRWKVMLLSAKAT